MKFTTGLCRLSYAHIFEPKEDLNGNLKYSCSLIIPKSDKAQIDRINAAFAEILDDKETVQKLGGKLKGIDLPLRDGDLRENDETYEDSMYLNAKSNPDHAPKVVLQDRTECVDRDDVYSGCYVQAVLSFFPYNKNGKKGIGVGLLAIRKIKDGAPLSGTSVSDKDFDDSVLGSDMEAMLA